MVVSRWIDTGGLAPKPASGTKRMRNTRITSAMSSASPCVADYEATPRFLQSSAVDWIRRRLSAWQTTLWQRKGRQLRLLTRSLITTLPNPTAMTGPIFRRLRSIADEQAHISMPASWVVPQCLWNAQHSNPFPVLSAQNESSRLNAQQSCATVDIEPFFPALAAMNLLEAFQIPAGSSRTSSCSSN